MFRTRDFLLVLVTSVFLLVAIGATVIPSLLGSTTISQWLLVDAPPDEYSVVVEMSPEMSRADRVEAMRQKISLHDEVILSAPVETAVVDTATTSDIATAPSGGEQRCVIYSAFTGAWPATSLEFEVIEGSRTVFGESAAVISAASSTAEFSTRTIYAQLPIRSQSSPTASCIASDVIGIAQDGSLIRNGEVGLYGVFDESTLIGYALDGFPIYGMSNQATDECGGIFTAGQYSYFLSAERETMINCFAALPSRI